MGRTMDVCYFFFIINCGYGYSYKDPLFGDLLDGDERKDDDDDDSSNPKIPKHKDVGAKDSTNPTPPPQPPSKEGHDKGK